jgi:peptide deformylase
MIYELSKNKEEHMAIRNILKGDDPVLRKQSRAVENFDDRLGTLIDDLFDTMRKADGCGLAAVQVGILRRVCVVDVEDGAPLALVNPQCAAMSGTQEGDEGCLSFPGEYVTIKRADFIRVTAQDRFGVPQTYEARGLKARAFQHEMEHMDGVVILAHGKPHGPKRKEG